ncbi:hypothetical protein EGR_07594 [Echinococcus granulosus]|uniref:Uncharacterized protein n=1 Tax=Echinococcus granulosus TaxID=6210 RepID=W6U8J9_ECHGR|nr:hypothetical protein EGR_07594 [Echinococcus granulosus]EUB57583.1 hypothetical protein EGR_07594 [Echinococcus granulosus]
MGLGSLPYRLLKAFYGPLGGHSSTSPPLRATLSSLDAHRSVVGASITTRGPSTTVIESSRMSGGK